MPRKRTVVEKQTTFAHGQRVVASAILKRVTLREPHPTRPEWTRTMKLWLRVDVNIELSCIYLGPRTLRDGVREWEEDVGATFAPEGAPVRAALVSLGLHRKPIYVPIDAITLTREHLAPETTHD